MDGALIAGDAGGFLNSFRLKGIHLAIKTGMLAAETAFEALRAGDPPGRGFGVTAIALTPAPCEPSCTPCGTFTRALGTGCAGPGVCGPDVADGGRGPVRSARAGRTRAMKTLAEYQATARAAHDIKRGQARSRG